MVLIIRDKDVEQFITYKDVINAVEDAYQQYGKGLAGGNDLIYGSPVISRCEMQVRNKHLPHGDPQVRMVSQDMAYLQETGKIFLRWNAYLGEKRSGISYLIDAKTGDILSIIKGTLSWRMRTASAGAVGAKYLSKTNSKIVGVIGTGRQGRAQLEALTNVRNIKTVYAYAGRKEDAHLTPVYAEEMSKQLGLKVVACDTAEEVVRNAKDILITCTRSTAPFIQGAWLNPGVHITAVGADGPLKVEFASSAIKRVDKIVVDHEIALDTKELRIPLEKKLIHKESIHGIIGEVVAGKVSGRETSTEITMFESTGTPLAYVTISAMMYKKAKELGLGETMNTDFLDLLYSK